MSRFLIYALVDPRTKQWRYIGKSCTGLRRPCKHASLALRENTHKACWIRGLQRAALTYEVEVLEEFASRDELVVAERDWIAAARAAFVPLTNLTSGGDGGAGPRSMETRAKIAAGLLGIKRSLKSIAKTQAGRIGFKHSEETRQLIGEQQRGRKQSPETVAKRVVHRIGFKQSAETVAKRVATRHARGNFKHSMEARARMSVAAKNRKRHV